MQNSNVRTMYAAKKAMFCFVLYLWVCIVPNHGQHRHMIKQQAIIIHLHIYFFLSKNEWVIFRDDRGKTNEKQ